MRTEPIRNGYGVPQGPGFVSLDDVPEGFAVYDEGELAPAGREIVWAPPVGGLKPVKRPALGVTVPSPSRERAAKFKAALKKDLK